MRRTLRIAAHNGAPEFGGAEIATALLLAGLRERGHEVALYYNRDVVADGARPYGIPLRHAHLGGDIAVHHAVRFALQLRRFRPDVLIVGTFRKLWLASLAARLAGVPLTVARIGLSTDTPRSAKYRFAYRRLVDLVVVNADDLAAAYREALPWAPPPRIVRIHKGVEAPPADPDRGAVRRRVRAELGIPAGATVIGGVGRLVEQKRFDRLLRALATLATEPATPSAVTPAPNPGTDSGT
ncbi:MAG TPA: glycosyltransferase, partial [Longimicrobiales bacterium]|nr:glycosyltransferase [Longimicrobiales bacterium]